MTTENVTNKPITRMDPAGSSLKFDSNEVIRPEARRAYGEDGATRSSGTGSGGYSKLSETAAIVKMDTLLTKGKKERETPDKILLQQAAAYAPLASLSGAETRRNSSLRRFRNHPRVSPSDGGRRGSTNKEEIQMYSDYAVPDDIAITTSTNSSSPVNSSGNKIHNKFLRSTRFFRTPRSGVEQVQEINSALSPPSSIFPPDNISRSDQRHDVEGYDPPRLSISSTEESSNGSEVKTPESLNESLSWNRGTSIPSTSQTKVEEYHPLHHSSLSLQNRKAREIIPLVIAPISSPSIVNFADEMAESEGLVKAEEVTNEERIDPAIVDAAIKFHWERKSKHQDGNAEEVLIGSEEVLSPIETSLQSRGGSTIRAKRPSTLLRLPSARTDDTAQPSPPSTIVSSAGPTPSATADNAYGKSRDPMEDAILAITADQILSSAFREESTSLPLSSSSLSSAHGNVTSFDSNRLTSIRSFNVEETSIEAQDHTGNNDRNGVASPDSWRSLLPEHDPYFISNEALSCRSSSRTQSLSGLNGGESGGEIGSMMQGRGRDCSASMIQTSSEGQMNSLSDRENRRLSTESVQSSAFSHSNNPLAASIYASSNASGSLYDLDGTYNSGGSRAAFAPLSYQYNHSTKSLTSPSFSATGKDNMSSITTGRDPLQFDEGLEEINSIQQSSAALHSAAARRHASFSAFDSNNSPHASQSNSSILSIQTAHQPIIHPDHHNRFRVLGNQQSQMINWEMSPERRQSIAWGQSPHSTRLGSISKASRVSPSSPTSNAMGNEGDRERWPCSRRLDNQNL